MSLNSIHSQSTSTFMLLPIVVQRHQELSSTDRKTYFLIIFCRFLIGAGIALALASFYLLHIVHPIIALSIPAIPIALGILGLQFFGRKASSSKIEETKTKNVSRKTIKKEELNTPQSISHPKLTWIPSIFYSLVSLTTSFIPSIIFSSTKKNVENPQIFPLGLDNKKANCWLNAVFQLIANSIYREDIDAIFKGSDQTLKKTLLPLKEAIDCYRLEAIGDRNFTKTISSVDTQLLREWLFKLKVINSASFRDQEDPFDFLKFFLKTTNHNMPNVVEETTNMRMGKISSYSKPSYSYDFITPDISPEKKNISLQKVLDNFFQFTNIVSPSITTKIMRSFTTSPKDLLIRLNRPIKDKAEEIDIKITIPLIFHAKKEQFGKKASYELDAFIARLGKTVNSGHYITYIRKQGKWWELNDRKISIINENEVQNLAKNNAYIVHYTQVK